MKCLRLLFRSLNRVPSIELKKIEQGSYSLGYFDRDYLRAVQQLVLSGWCFTCKDIVKLIKTAALEDSGKLAIVLALSQKCIDPDNLAFIHLAFNQPGPAGIALSQKLGIKVIG